MRRFLIAWMFFVAGFAAMACFGSVFWADAPGTVIVGCVWALAALSVVVYGISHG